MRPAEDGHASGHERGHALLPHTADVGIAAFGPTLGVALEEAAAALGELAADLPARSRSPIVAEVRLDAPDHGALLVSWLNELIGLIDVRRAALLDTSVEVADPSIPSLRARVRLVPFTAGARPRVHVKSATFHRLEAARDGAGWRLRAYLDV